MKTKKLLALILSSCMILPMAACAKKSQKTSNINTAGDHPSDQTAIFELTNAQLPNNSVSEDELKKAYSKFVFGVLQRCLANAHGSNVLISSDSILFALDLAASGANGETLDQMLQTMMPGVPNEQGFQFAVDRMDDLSGDQLKIANSAWINSKYNDTVYKDYYSSVQDNFDAEVQSIKFDNDATKTINKWVSDKTDGMIKELIDSVDSRELMILINAICFDAKWEEPYKENNVDDGCFYETDGSEHTVTFLKGSQEDADYLECDSASGFLKEYKGGKYAFLTILPNDAEIDINEFMQDFTPDEYWDLWESRDSNVQLVYRFPEFKAEYATSLAGTLRDMGMEDAFSRNADFSNMTSEAVLIDEVIHKTYIEVNAQGTRAAAATAVEIKTHSASIADPFEEIKYVICDRPFAYAIVDTDTGLPVFLGTVETVDR
ncbi:MAG: serpin family protein [Clostridiales bacterium]|nr:serpin family protein [Clostridiales bacterium]